MWVGQGSGSLPNSAADPLPAGAQIVFKLLICLILSTLRGQFSGARTRFSLRTGKSDGLSHGRRVGGLFHLDQLQGFAARAFDHHGARVAERVGLFEEFDALAAQLLDPRVEILDA